jgi:flagellar biosynthesis GTPase FlhF
MNPETTSETSLVVASRRDLPVFTLNRNPDKEAALEQAALIGKVSTRDTKIVAVRAQQALKKVISDLEKARKFWKEPLLQRGRELDTLIEREKLEPEKELARVTQEVSVFDLAERRRVEEEERLQREQVARIQRDRDAELARLAAEQAAKEAEARREQEEADRKAREAQQAAAALAAAATTKAQQEAAQQAQEKATKALGAAFEVKQAQDARIEALAAQTAALAQQIDEKAADAAYVAARPIEATHVAGQRKATGWKIEIVDVYMLAKFRPDLVEFKPKLGEIKACLNDGQEIRGIKAEREYTSGVRLAPERKAIDV